MNIISDLNFFYYKCVCTHLVPGVASEDIYSLQMPIHVL